MKTYQDLIEVGENDAARKKFILDAIGEHKSSQMYRIAADAVEYEAQRNVTITKYQKLLYDLKGQAVPDRFTANHRCASNFFDRFVTQRVSYLLGNGVSFDKKDTKAKLGKNIDTVLYKGVKDAVVQGVSFGFFNFDSVKIFKLLEFVPLYDEENGALRAGIRFWQVSNDKPLRATLYEEDGYTDYIKRDGDDALTVISEKKTYREKVVTSEADGTEIYEGENYPSFPIVPLWGSTKKQSALVGMRENIDCYDLIKSGFANDLDDASFIYWTLENAGGMGDIDLAQFVERMKTLRAAVVDGDNGAKATAHTMEVPYESREIYLKILKNDMYDDFMALNVSEIAAGKVTATQIEAAYEPLNEKADELEFCIIDFITGILSVAGIADDVPTFKRSQIRNEMEQTEMVLAAAEYIDDETVLKKLPWITDDEIGGILKRKDAEGGAKYGTPTQTGTQNQNAATGKKTGTEDDEDGGANA